MTGGVQIRRKSGMPALPPGADPDSIVVITADGQVHAVPVGDGGILTVDENGLPTLVTEIGGGEL